MKTLTTARLLLREWRDGDIDAFARMNADAGVMRYFPTTLTREESVGLLSKVRQHFGDHGFGPWALDLHGEFIGYCGLMHTAFAPWIEIAWRIAKEHQNQGYATEAARAALHDGFERLCFREIVAFTVPANLPSRRVMEKLGMKFDREFDHPKLPEGHELRRHVLYRLAAP